MYAFAMTSTIAERVAEVRRRIEAACARSGRSPNEVILIAVTKGFGSDAIRAAVEAGVRDIGENRVQEAGMKRVALGDLPEDVTWHMIGHLQSNKVKAALETFDTIQSVDSIHLADAISTRASKPVRAFLEVNVANEPSKSGFSLTELPSAFEHVSQIPNLDVRGLMTVAPFSDDPKEVRPVFRRLRTEAEALGLRQLSMGMTNDFEVAIEEGATHVRVGRAILGDRA